LYQALRCVHSDGRKEFSQRRPDGKGGYAWNLQGVTPVPYKLPELLEADPSEPVWIVEGEKCADRLWEEKLVATTNAQGANNTKVWDELAPYFQAMNVYILPDNDEPGRKHAAGIADRLLGVAASVKVVPLPGLAPKGDVVDWLMAGHSIDDLGRLAHRAPAWAKGGPVEAGPAVEPAPAAPEGPNYAIAPERIRPRVVHYDRVVAEPIEWLVPDRIPLGMLTLIAGDPGLGKSFFTIDLAAGVSTGGAIPFGGGGRYPQGGVILFSAEDDDRYTIKPRLQAAGADCSQVIGMPLIDYSDGSLASWNLGHMGHLESLIDLQGNTRLIILDPVTSYMPGGTDDHKNRDVRGVLQPLVELAGRRRIAVVLVTHLNKSSSGQKSMYRVTGAGAYVAVSRVSYLVGTMPDDPARVCVMTMKCNIAPKPPSLAYQNVPATIVSGPPGAEQEIQTCRIQWDPNPVDVTADEALNADRNATMPGRMNAAGKSEEAAADWLQGFLADGRPRPSKLIFEEGKRAGFGRDRLYKAKETLGIKPQKAGYDEREGKINWTWQLPDQPDFDATVPMNSQPF
jgi:hypothetical protein